MIARHIPEPRENKVCVLRMSNMTDQCLTNLETTAGLQELYLRVRTMTISIEASPEFPFFFPTLPLPFFYPSLFPIPNPLLPMCPFIYFALYRRYMNQVFGELGDSSEN
jgi:hypothetical protein